MNHQDSKDTKPTHPTDEKPQITQIDADLSIHPFLNRQDRKAAHHPRKR
jgi:hypothetical protein